MVFCHNSGLGQARAYRETMASLGTAGDYPSAPMLGINKLERQGHGERAGNGERDGTKRSRLTGQGQRRRIRDERL